MSTLVITIKADEQDMALAGFPLTDEQYIIDEVQTDDRVVVYVNISAADTTAAQEAFLNASEAVMYYQVV